jgi:hypothetical protein
MTVRRRAIYPADIRQLGGCVSVLTGRDRVDGSPFFQIQYVSGGGDIFFQSRPLADEGAAFAASQVVAEIFGGVVRL